MNPIRKSKSPINFKPEGKTPAIARSAERSNSRPAKQKSSLSHDKKETKPKLR